MAKKTKGKPRWCETKYPSKACEKRQKGKGGNRCRLECKFAKK